MKAIQLMRLTRITLLFFFIIGPVAYLTTPVLSKSGSTARVIVRETPLRAGQSFFADTLEMLIHEQEVELLSSRRSGDDWLKVRAESGKEGWVHRSALDTRRFAFSSGQEDARKGADTQEVSLAARGFNEQVEASYRAEKAIDYTGVDKMERLEMDLDSLKEFLRQGSLILPEGWAQ